MSNAPARPPKIEIDRPTLEKLLRGYDSRLDLVDITALAGGANSTVYAVKVRPGGVRDLVVKIYRPDDNWEMAQEVYVYGLLTDHTDVSCPRVLHHDDSRTVVPYSFLIMEMLDGQPVFSADLNDADYESLYRQIGRLLRRCHVVTFDQFGFISPKGQLQAYDRNRDFMSARFDGRSKSFVTPAAEARSDTQCKNELIKRTTYSTRAARRSCATTTSTRRTSSLHVETTRGRSAVCSTLAAPSPPTPSTTSPAPTTGRRAATAANSKPFSMATGGSLRESRPVWPSTCCTTRLN